MAIAVIVSTFTVSSAMQTQVGNEIEKYGPNIVVTPNTQSISVPYGNVVIGNVTIAEAAATFWSAHLPPHFILASQC